MNNILVSGFYFERPLLLFQSDDWGRVGLRDHAGKEELQCAGIALGAQSYDFYTLETAEDLSALSTLLRKHRDSEGRSPCLEMNFIVANLEFANAVTTGELSFLPLAEGLPKDWVRPNLADGYRSGIGDGVFTAALHGTSHFCRSAVEQALLDPERGKLLRLFWRCGTPYIHWRMPWIGYEYWDPAKSADRRFLDFDSQKKFIGEAVGAFAKMFSKLPVSACAPGYRANDDTHRAWSEHGIRIAQNGPGSLVPPHVGRHEILHLTRNIDFEPWVDPAFSLENCLGQAERCFSLGIPAIVSVHSINFHSTVKDFRSRTLELLDQFMTTLESRHPDVLYLRDEDLYEAINQGKYQAPNGTVDLHVIKRRFSASQITSAKS